MMLATYNSVIIITMIIMEVTKGWNRDAKRHDNKYTPTAAKLSEAISKDHDKKKLGG